LVPSPNKTTAATQEGDFMAKKSKQTSSSKKSKGQPTTKGEMKKPGTKYLGLSGFSVKDLFDPFDAGPDHEFARGILLTICSAITTVVLMAQLRFSAAEEPAEYMDRLPSYRDYKKLIMNGYIGDTFSYAVGIRSTLPYIIESSQHQQATIDDTSESALCYFLESYAECGVPNSKRIKTPNSKNWVEYLNGEASSTKGKLLSAPSSNILLFNLNPKNVESLNIAGVLALTGLSEETLKKYSITVDEIREHIYSAYMSTVGGIPTTQKSFDEPAQLRSAIEEEIFVDRIVRTGEINDSLVKGDLPDSPITRDMIEGSLSRMELLAYDTAQRMGDQTMLRKLTAKVKKAVKVSGPKGSKPAEAAPE